MIRIKPNPTFRFKVDLAIPGSAEPAKLTFVGRHQGQAALRQWAEGAKDLDGNDAAFLLPVLDGWDDVVDEDGKPVKWSSEALGALLDAYPGSGLQIFSVYVRELSASRGKN